MREVVVKEGHEPTEGSGRLARIVRASIVHFDLPLHPRALSGEQPQAQEGARLLGGEHVLDAGSDARGFGHHTGGVGFVPRRYGNVTCASG